MLQYERIDFSKMIDFNKSSKSKKCMICHYWYFIDIGYKFQPYVCNCCHDISMMAYELKNIAILNVSVDYRCILWGISRNGAVNILNKSKLDDKGVLQMDSGINETLVKAIKESAFGRTYFKWYRKSWKEFDELKVIYQKYYCSN